MQATGAVSHAGAGDQEPYFKARKHGNGVYVLVVVLSLIAAVAVMVGSRAAGFVLTVAAVAQVVAIVLLGGLSDPYGIAGIVLAIAALAAGLWFAFDKDAPAPPRRDDDLAQWAAQQRLSGH